MGFQLVIAEGKEAGREFVFDQPSVLIGRTSECDVVLYDPGVSRKHARVFSDGPGYAVEDMGSSNGTKVNGSIVKKKVLKDGDAISLGPVVFNFTGGGSEALGSEDDGAHSTRIVSSAEVKKRTKGKGQALIPEGSTNASLSDLARSSTRSMQAVPRPGSKSRASAVVRRSNPAGTPSGSNALSAVEKARIKRASGSNAGLKVWWLEASQGKRVGAILGVVALLGAISAGAYFAFKPAPPVIAGPEPTALSREPIEASFGLAADGDPEPVTYSRPDQKQFEFDFFSATKAVAILHYQARDISAGEVTISINGEDLGTVPPDTLQVKERMMEKLIQPRMLKKTGEGVNRISFDNVKNPPGNDPWRIWNVFLEMAVLPDLPPNELALEALRRYKKGVEQFEQRDIGAANRWNAFRSFREAWLMLESMPDPKPATYSQARDRMAESEAELSHQCSKLLLGARSSYNQKNYDVARHELEQVKVFFPEKGHACPLLAEDLRIEWEL